MYVHTCTYNNILMCMYYVFVQKTLFQASEIFLPPQWNLHVVDVNYMGL